VHLKREEGAAAVEFALLLPLLLMILFGIIEFGLVLYNQEVITNASREGARFGIVMRAPKYTSAEIEDAVKNYITPRLICLGSCPSPAVKAEGAGGLFGSDLKVHVEYTYDFLVLPSFAASLGDTLTLKAETVMKME
jgi:TadE-like protein